MAAIGEVVADPLLRLRVPQAKVTGKTKSAENSIEDGSGIFGDGRGRLHSWYALAGLGKLANSCVYLTGEGAEEDRRGLQVGVSIRNTIERGLT